MDKFGRSYILDVKLLDGTTLTIKPPFTIEFDIMRRTLSSANNSVIKIYNLSELNRSNLQKNIWNFGALRPILLRAGYGTNLPIIFKGTIQRAFSVRQGVNFITQIEAFDAGFDYVNSKVNKSFPAGVTYSFIIKSLIESFTDVELGFIGDYPSVTTRGSSYVGNIGDILKNLSDGGFFIDNGIANVIHDNESLQGELELIDSANGLLGTPRLEENNLIFDMVFEPRVKLGQKITLKSSTAKNFNGVYKVVSVQHRGTISESICGEVITSIGQFGHQKNPQQ